MCFYWDSYCKGCVLLSLLTMCGIWLIRKIRFYSSSLWSPCLTGCHFLIVPQIWLWHRDSSGYFYHRALEMGRIGKEVSGQVLCMLGVIGLCVTCGVPIWRTTTYIGANIVTGQIIWDGLWMNCVMQSTGQMQCKIQSSIMSLTQDLQAAQALIVIAIVVGFAGVLMTLIGGRCTTCLKNESSMAKLVILGGILCIVAAVLCLIPCCWSAAYTVSDYDSPLVPTTRKREIGPCIYIGWGTSFLLLLGGIILCTACPPNDLNNPNTYPYKGPYMAPPGYYMPPKPHPQSVTYSGTYVPGKTYAAPRVYSPVPRQYL